MKVREDRLKKVLFFYAWVILSFLAQNSIIKGAMQTWEPSLPKSVLLLTLLVTLIIFSARQGEKAAFKGRNYLFQFWAFMMALVLPWIGYFSIRIINILK